MPSRQRRAWAFGAGSKRAGEPLLLAHRGASAEAPENTLAAFRLAMDEGADGLELDVWRCGSGEVVVHHDRDARRSAGSALRLDRAPWNDLRRLDVGAWKGERFEGERIPLLEEVLAALPAALVNVELKSQGWPDLRLATAVAKLLDRLGAGSRCLVSSFEPALLAAFRLRAPRVATGLLVEAPRCLEGRAWDARARLVPRVLGVGAIHPPANQVTAKRMAAWRRERLLVNVWTVDAPGEARRLAALGVDALVTNRPAELHAALGGRHLSCLSKDVGPLRPGCLGAPGFTAPGLP